MGTTWSVSWISSIPPNVADVVGLKARLEERLETLERVFSTYRPDSEVSRFNQTRSREWFPVSPEFARLALQAQALSADTEGAFDVTVAPLLKVWGVSPHHPPTSWPTPAAIAAARTRVAASLLEARLNPPGLRKSLPEVNVEFSSITKGFAVDELSDLLVRLGFTNHLVGIGGDLRAMGSGPAGEGWRVAIERPAGYPDAVAGVVYLRNRALSTSGNYRNYHLIAGRRVGHLVDPRTGLPTTGTLAAVSVLHISCATSSALATGLFVLGSETGFLLATRAGLAAHFFVDKPPDALHSQATPAFPTLHPVN